MKIKSWDIIIKLLCFTVVLWMMNTVVVATEKKATALVKTEYPFIDTRGIAVNDQGLIYCGVHFFGVIQVYNLNGEFLYGLKIDAADGDFNFKLDQNDNLIVATVRNDKVFTINKQGEIISEETNDNAYYEIGEKYKYAFIDKQGNLYQIRNPLLLFPHIVKINSNNTEILISISFITLIFLRLFPAFMTVGLLLYTSLNLKRIKEIIKSPYS